MASATSRTVRRRCSLIHGVTSGRPDRLHEQQSSIRAPACNGTIACPCRIVRRGVLGCRRRCGSATEARATSRRSVLAEEHEGHRARRQERPERDVLLAARAARPRSARCRSPRRRGTREQAAEHVAASPASRGTGRAGTRAARRRSPCRPARRGAARRRTRTRPTAPSSAAAERRPVVLEQRAEPRAAITLANPTGYTMRFGMMKCSRSITEIAISAGRQHEERRQRPRVGEARADRREQHRGEQLDERIADRDRLAAVPAPAAQQQPRHDRDVVARRDRRVARRAVRARRRRPTPGAARARSRRSGTSRSTSP